MSYRKTVFLLFFTAALAAACVLIARDAEAVQSVESHTITVTDASEPSLIGLQGTLVFVYTDTDMKFAISLPGWSTGGIIDHFYTSRDGWEASGRNVNACKYEGTPGHLNTYVTGDSSPSTPALSRGSQESARKRPGR